MALGEGDITTFLASNITDLSAKDLLALVSIGFRNMNGLSQRDLAKQISLTQAHICGIERKKHEKFSKSTVGKYCFLAMQLGIDKDLFIEKMGYDSKDIKFDLSSKKNDELSYYSTYRLLSLIRECYLELLRRNVDTKDVISTMMFGVNKGSIDNSSDNISSSL